MKPKEALILNLLNDGYSYTDIQIKANVSPSLISLVKKKYFRKVLDDTTSTTSTTTTTTTTTTPPTPTPTEEVLVSGIKETTFDEKPFLKPFPPPTPTTPPTPTPTTSSIVEKKVVISKPKKQKGEREVRCVVCADRLRHGKKVYVDDYKGIKYYTCSRECCGRAMWQMRKKIAIFEDGSRAKKYDKVYAIGFPDEERGLGVPSGYLER